MRLIKLHKLFFNAVNNNRRTLMSVTQFFSSGIMPKRRLGTQGPWVPALGLGCMGMSEFYGKNIDEKECLTTIEEALKNGCMLDTADVYGYGANEELIGKVLKGSQQAKKCCFIATKCGIVRDKNDPKKRGIDNSPEYIVQCCEASLKRLGIDCIDLYYLHRIAKDGKDIEKSMEGMAKLLKDGKIRYVGLSEANSETIRRAHAALLRLTDEKHGLTAVQSEYSLMTRTPEIDGSLKACKDLGIGFVPYSPLGRKLLTDSVSAATEFEEGDFRRDLPRFQTGKIEKNRQIVVQIAEVAKAKRCTPAQLSLAWVLAQGDMIVPIPGTKRLRYLQDNLGAVTVILSKEEVEMLNKIAPIGVFDGDRYSPAAMQSYGFKTEAQIIAEASHKPLTEDGSTEKSSLGKPV